MKNSKSRISVKKFFAAACFLLFLVTGVSAQTNVSWSSYGLEADILMKAFDQNPSRLAWRNVLYAENVVVEGSSGEFILKTANVKKGYSAFVLYQEGGKSFSVNANGKEQKFVPGKLFEKAAGAVWLSFTAPDKNKYALPTDIKILTKEEFEALNKKDEVKAEDTVSEETEIVLETESAEETVAQEIPETEESDSVEPAFIVPVSEEITEAAEVVEVLSETESSEAVETSEKTEIVEGESEESAPEEETVSKIKEKFVFVRDSRNFPKGEPEEIVQFAGVSRQTVEKETNVATVIRNVPEGTKPKLFLMNGLEVLVYIAPDLTLHSDDNCYSLFYTTRTYGKEEGFAIPKRVIENPKINGKLTNMLDFDGCVTTVGGKQKLVLVWTQCTVQNTEETLEESDLLKKTAVYWSTWKENDKSWEKSECISEMKGSLQFDPSLVYGEKGLVLKIRNRPDNTISSVSDNPAFAEKQNYFLLNKKGVWETCGAGDFSDLWQIHGLTDANNNVPEETTFVFNRQNGVAGALWSSGNQVFAKTYIKSPDTKKMMWTDSVPVIYQGKNSQCNIEYPYAMVRDTGDWIVTFVQKTENGNNICISKVNNEPCIVTRKLIPDLRDLQKPGNPVHFTVILENRGIGIAPGMDVVIRNEFRTEAGVVSYKNNFYPGVTYELQGIYQKLKGKDGIVPVEEIYADVKFAKMKRNSEFAFYDARYTLGIPKFTIGDMFVTTKGKSQKVTYTLGTSNGIKVKAPACEVVVTEHIDSPEYEDNVSVVSVDNYFSDEYLEMNFDYETAELDEKSFNFNAYFHFEESKRKIPGWEPDEIEKETAVSASCEVYNPIYTKPSFSVQIMKQTFTKKTRVMEAEFDVSNNWPEMIAGSVKFELFNVSTGKIEQTAEVDFDLDVLENKKGILSFVPAQTDVAADYVVRIRK